MIASAAFLRPDYEFVLIGQVHEVDATQLRVLENVHLLGEKHYRELPGYLQDFDVCLIPFRINTLTRAVDPVKLYEYLSQGKPVVATRLPELVPLEELLYLTEGVDDFVSCLDRAISEGNADMVLARRPGGRDGSRD